MLVGVLCFADSNLWPYLVTFLGLKWPQKFYTFYYLIDQCTFIWAQAKVISFFFYGFFFLISHKQWIIIRLTPTSACFGMFFPLNSSQKNLGWLLRFRRTVMGNSVYGLPANEGRQRKGGR